MIICDSDKCLSGVFSAQRTQVRTPNVPKVSVNFDAGTRIAWVCEMGDVPWTRQTIAALPKSTGSTAMPGAVPHLSVVTAPKCRASVE
jgi:hypothetical protein